MESGQPGEPSERTMRRDDGGAGRRHRSQNHTTKHLLPFSTLLRLLTEGFNGSGHGVGSVHAPARTGSWTRMSDNFLSFVFGDFVIYVLSIRLKGTDNVKWCTRRGLFAGTDCTTVYHDRRTIESGHGHDAPGHILVASRKCDETIVPLSTHGSFDRIGNQVTTLQRVPHPICPHTDPIRNTDGIETVSNTPGRLDTVFDFLRQIQ